MATKKRYICLSRMPSAKKISVKILSEKGILRRRIKGEEIGEEELLPEIQLGISAFIVWASL